jgi:hypothetical protein
MSDLFFLTLLAVLTLLTAGLVVLCDRLMGGSP